MSDDADETERVRVLHHCGTHKVIQDSKGKVRSLAPIVQGEPIPENTDIVQFTEVEGSPDYEDMTTVHRGSGPAKVNSRKYKSGWDNIFGSGPKGQKEVLN